VRRAVFTYWQMPDEEPELIEFMGTTGPVVSYPGHWVRTLVEAKPIRIDRFLIQYNSGPALLGQAAHSTEVIIEPAEKDNQQFFSVNLMNSCLIGYNRSQLRGGNRLVQSNLCAYLTIYKNHVECPKPEWFQSWVKRIISWARKRAKAKCTLQGFPYPATPLVAKLAKEREIELEL